MNKQKKQKICYKCKGKPEYYFRNELYVCFTCFWDIMNKKFRSFLKSKMQIQGKNLNVFSFYDGSLNSIILNSLYKSKVQYFLNPKNPLKDFVKFNILYVDFSSFEKMISQSDTETQLIIDKEQKFERFKKYIEIDFSILKVEDYYNLDELKEEFLKIKSLGGFKLDYLYLIRDKIITQYLLKQKATHYLTSENSEQLGSRCLKLMCKSRNMELIQQCSPLVLIEQDDIKIKHGRPLSEFMNKDIYYLIYKKDYSQYSFEQFDFVEKFYSKKEKKLPGHGSIDNVLTEFVSTLQDRYHSTTNTILKTVVKVQDQQKDKEGLKCQLCQRVFIEIGEYCKGCKVIKELTLSSQYRQR